MTATLTKWYEEHGRHEIFAGGKKVKMEDEATSTISACARSIVTNELTARSRQAGHREDGAGRKEARDAMPRLPANAALPVIRQTLGRRRTHEAYNARMAALYREVVSEREAGRFRRDGFIPLGALSKPNGNGSGNGNEARAPKPEIASQWRGY